MSKHREALRRGIRSLIHETSRELAEIEGREPPAEIAEPAPVAKSAPTAEAAPAAERRDTRPEHGAAASPAAVEDRAEANPRRVEAVSAAARPANEALVRPAPAPIHPAPAAGSGVPGAEREPALGAAPGASPAPTAGRASGAEPTPPRSASREPPADGPLAPSVASRGVTAPASPQASPTGMPAPSAGTKTPARAAAVRRDRRKSGAARRRSRIGGRASPGQTNGLDVHQVHPRKGVCIAYFVNQECWRVPDAYCNTALQICAMRACPVFHLHRAALERRFAGKYKHFW